MPISASRLNYTGPLPPKDILITCDALTVSASSASSASKNILRDCIYTRNTWWAIEQSICTQLLNLRLSSTTDARWQGLL